MCFVKEFVEIFHPSILDQKLLIVPFFAKHLFLGINSTLNKDPSSNQQHILRTKLIGIHKKFNYIKRNLQSNCLPTILVSDAMPLDYGFMNRYFYLTTKGDIQTGPARSYHFNHTVIHPSWGFKRCAGRMHSITSILHQWCSSITYHCECCSTCYFQRIMPIHLRLKK